MIKNFSIFKNKETTNEKAPQYSISANIGSTDEPTYVTIGGCWSKEGKNGKFLSCKLQDAWVDHGDKTKSRAGYTVVNDVIAPVVPPQPVEQDMDGIPF